MTEKENWIYFVHMPLSDHIKAGTLEQVVGKIERAAHIGVVYANKPFLTYVESLVNRIINAE